jgi:tRNA-binding EMAP/Myf-like protein
MAEQTHKVEIVRVQVEPHPNADRLDICRIFGFTCCVAKGSFVDGQLAAYIQPDSVVDSKLPEFEFLAGHERIKVKRLRGVVSMGLLMPAPEGAQEGDDVAEHYGVTHYEPPIQGERCGEVEGGPIGIYAPKYDVESMYRYKSLFVEGETVIATEKIHGCVTSKALVSLANGETQYISTLKVGQDILGVDINGKLTTTRILNTFNNGKAERWLKIKGNRRACGRGSSFFALICTPEHNIWSASQQDYVRADSLNVGEKVSLVRSEMGLTPIQEQMLLGKLLGDGSISITDHSAHISWTHRKADEGYIDWCGQAIGSIDSGVREPLTSGYGSAMIRSRTSNSFWIKDKFETFIVGGNKVVPEWVADELSPLSLAFWYMDDGSLGTQEDQEDRAMFATCGFTDSDCRILLRGLNRLGINGNLVDMIVSGLTLTMLKNSSFW